MNATSLHKRLRYFGRRVLAVGVAAGVAWGIAAAVVLLLVSVWLDLLWELPPSVRIAGTVLALVVLVLLIVIVSD